MSRPEGYEIHQWRAEYVSGQGWEGQTLIRGRWVQRFLMRWTDGMNKHTEQVVEFECKRLVACWNENEELRALLDEAKDLVGRLAEQTMLQEPARDSSQEAIDWLNSLGKRLS